MTTGVWGAFTSALVPKWRWYAGPNWGIDGPAGWLGIPPLGDPIDEAAYYHDLGYTVLSNDIRSGQLTQGQAAPSLGPFFLLDYLLSNGISEYDRYENAADVYALTGRGWWPY